jgi:hypothetical protein
LLVGVLDIDERMRQPLEENAPRFGRADVHASIGLHRVGAYHFRGADK